MTTRQNAQKFQAFWEKWLSQMQTPVEVLQESVSILQGKARQDEEALEVRNDTWAQTHLPSMRMWKLQITCKQINHESLCSSAKHSIGKHVLTHEVEQKQ